MVERIDDISWQAHQGSVAAIIQILNDKLATSGVRTRAIFDHGVLQLLCEAQTADKLEQSILVKQIQQILESIAPRNIRRVNINSRIVREQQLLWLEEISRDPENQLLWSQEITLKKPHLLRHRLNEWNQNADTAKPNLPTRSPRQQREQRQFWRGLVGGASVSLLLLLGGWAVYNWLGTAKDQAVKPEQAGQGATEQTATPAPAASSPSGLKQDPFS